MVQVPLTINGRSYRVACDEGQEERVQELARVVDDTVQELVGRVGQVGEMQLLVMAAILLADEVEEARSSGVGAADEAEDATVVVLEACASRLEAIAERLEQA